MEQTIGVLIGVTAPIWMAVGFYYLLKVVWWLDGRPWDDA